MKTHDYQSQSRPKIDGKFFELNQERYYIKGATYGTFAPDESGNLFPSSEIVEKDFQLMMENGINTVRTYTVPPLSLLDLALKYGLKVMVGMPWEQHLTFLESKKHEMDILKRTKENAEKCEKHPAIFCYAIGNEIPSSIVRWYGEKRISKFLHKLYKTVKSVDPDGLVTYVNYPTTEYLELSFLDFDCFNVFLETKEKLSKYLARLHNLAKDKPLILSEIGLDSSRNGLDKQAETLDWQVSTIFEKGCAGCFVFSWTDDWWRGGLDILDWDFGLVDRSRVAKPALHTIRKVFSDVPFTSHQKLPMISVVVCSYNGAATIRDTMEGLKKLNYPSFEVIVVDDGSTDDTPHIASQYDVNLITTKNKGLSSARNTGLYAAKGEIIAYLDDDAYPDPEWLKYIASAYLDSNHAGIGGPNLPPAGDGEIAACVSNAPGGPLHVLLDDEIAEHIPGCNMTFKKSALLEIGGFDPVFRAAGDDVDICWRIQEKGYTIGFHPSAFVWHHRRNSLRMYWKQQQGYGKAEALLEKKWPEKYNSLGHLSWKGHIYGNGLTKPYPVPKKKIFYGSQGTALFQSVYQSSSNIFRSYSLMPEWFFFILILALVSLLGMEWKPLYLALPVFVFSIFLVIVQAAVSARSSVFTEKPKTTFKRFKYYGITTFLYIMQPIARLKGRIKHGLFPLRDGLSNLRYFRYFSILSSKIEFWSEEWRPMEDWLEDISKSLISFKNKVKKGGEYDRWDFQYQTGPFIYVRALLTIEEHGMGRQNLKLKKQMLVSNTSLALIAILLFLTYQAYSYEAFISSSIFGIFSSFLILKLIADALYTKASLVFALNSLSQNSIKEEVIEPLSKSREAMEDHMTPVTLREWTEDRSVISQDSKTAKTL